MTAAERQMLLFAELPPVPAAPKPPLRRAVRRAAAAAGQGLQLAFAFVLKALERDDIDDPDDRPVRRIVKATEAPPVQTKGVPSIFSMADAAHAFEALSLHGRFGDAAGFTAPRGAAPVVRREGGVTRVQGAAYPGNRWTAEREEQERIRRAKQKPPRPVKGARTKSKKLKELIGDRDHDD